MRRVVGQKVEAQVRSQVKEPLVKLVYSCDIHYAEDRPNGFGGTHLVMTSKTLEAEAIVPASVAVEIAKDLAEDIWYESNNPCNTYDCENAWCRGLINTLKSLAEEYKHLQDKEPDYVVWLLDEDGMSDVIEFALDYTKKQGLLDDFAKIVSYAFPEVTDAELEELLQAGYSPEEVYKAFSKYLADYEVLRQMCYLRDRYPEVKKFLEEMGFNCDED